MPRPSVELDGRYKQISETCPRKRILYQSHSASLLYQVYYAFGVNSDVLRKYAIKSKILLPNATFNISHAEDVTRRLSYIVDERLQLIAVASDEHRYALALYDNYHAWERKLEPEDEKEVLAIIKEELECEGSFMWYHALG